MKLWEKTLAMYKTHSCCRSCNYASIGANGIKSAPTSERLLPVFDLGLQPLANDFTKPGYERAGYAPLEVLLCPRCHLAQLSVVVKPEILYSNYLYTTSASDTMRRHFDQLATDIAHEVTPFSVVEIGSNDGSLLSVLGERWGIKTVWGIEPASNLVELSVGRGVKTIRSLFNSEVATEVKEMLLTPLDVVIARHVFCHIDDWRGFVKALDALCTESTLVCIETPYVQDLLSGAEFDTIYHEHLSYLNIASIKALLKESPFKLQRIIRYPIHGGAILLMLRRRESPQPAHDSVQEFLSVEDVGPEKWYGFRKVAGKQIADLGSMVRGLVADGKTVAGLGASAKSTVWVNACKFTRKDVAFIADSTPGKWFSTSPGSDVPIVDEGAILRELPDYVICFAWNFRVEILEKFMPARTKGVKFIIPVPSIVIV